MQLLWCFCSVINKAQGNKGPGFMNGVCFSNTNPFPEIKRAHAWYI